MRTPRLLAAAITLALAASCAGVRQPSRDPRLLDDCGGFVPAAPLLDRAAAFGDPSRREAALSALEEATPAERVDVLRAGLRLRDPAPARACAARLAWEQIDRWECARCVDLLVDGIQRPDGEGDLELFRSYLGSVELPRYLRALPPPPRKDPTDYSIGQVHRIARGVHIPDYLALTRRDPEMADTAIGEIGLLGLWNDEHRDEVQRAFLLASAAPPPGACEPRADGLPPLLAAGLAWPYLDSIASRDVDPAGSLPGWDLRWLWESTPAPRDADLLTALASLYPDNPFGPGGVALTLLGKLADPETEAYLRHRAAEDEDDSAIWALARRGDAAMIERTATQAAGGAEFALAALMEADPARARRLLDESLLGADEAKAGHLLDALERFATPGAFFEPFGYDWRRTSLAGLDRAAIDAHLPAVRLARIGVTVPGCRTRALAEAAVSALRPGDLVDDRIAEEALGRGQLDEIGGFLETAAPASFTAALRAIRKAGLEDAPLATDWLVAMGDAETAAAVVAEPTDDWHRYVELARSRSPAVIAHFEKRIREERDLPPEKSDVPGLVVALAVTHGLPEEAASALTYSDTPLPPAALDAVLDGRPVDALAAVLAAHPDDWTGAVGAVDDPRVRAWLARLRERRDLGLYWYATGQLAVLRDQAALADFWGAMQDGRYRIQDEAEEFERTLGWDLAATMPFWIEELRSQCCRIVTSGAGDIVEKLLGLPDGCFHSPYRTAWRRAREWWESAGGRFVRSRILSDRICPRFVPQPR